MTERVYLSSSEVRSSASDIWFLMIAMLLALGIVTEMQEKEKEGIPMLDAYGRALGERLIQSGKSRRDVFNEGFHRYMSDDRENLPSWFLDDEKKFCVKV